MRTGGLAAILATALWVTPTHGEELFSYFQRYDDLSQARLEFSPCTGNEVDECISHSLSCDNASGGQPQLTIAGGTAGNITSSLIANTEGETTARLKLIKGSTNLPITSIQVSPDEMDGGRTVSLGVGTADDFFNALTEQNSEGASLIVAGERFPLAPQKGDGKKLVAWKYTCMALEGQNLPRPTSPAPVKTDVKRVAEMVTLLTKNVTKASDLLKACENTYKSNLGVSEEEALFNTVRCEEALQFGFDFTNFIYELSRGNTIKVCWSEPNNRKIRSDDFVEYLRSIKGIENYTSASVLYAFSAEHYKCEKSESAQ